MSRSDSDNGDQGNGISNANASLETTGAPTNGNYPGLRFGKRIGAKKDVTIFDIH